MSDQSAAPTRNRRKTTTTTTDEHEPPRVIDAREAARILGRDYYTVRRWALSGELPLVRFPSVEPLKGRKSSTTRTQRRLLFDRADVLAFITRCKQAV